MGFFENLKIKSEAKRLGFTLDEYNDYLEAEKFGISADEYRRWIKEFKKTLTLEEYGAFCKALKVKGEFYIDCKPHITEPSALEYAKNHKRISLEMFLRYLDRDHCYVEAGFDILGGGFQYDAYILYLDKNSITEINDDVCQDAEKFIIEYSKKYVREHSVIKDGVLKEYYGELYDLFCIPDEVHTIAENALNKSENDYKIYNLLFHNNFKSLGFSDCISINDFTTFPYKEKRLQEAMWKYRLPDSMEYIADYDEFSFGSTLDTIIAPISLKGSKVLKGRKVKWIGEVKKAKTVATKEAKSNEAESNGTKDNAVAISSKDDNVDNFYNFGLGSQTINIDDVLAISIPNSFVFGKNIVHKFKNHFTNKMTSLTYDFVMAFNDNYAKLDGSGKSTLELEVLKGEPLADNNYDFSSKNIVDEILGSKVSSTRGGNSNPKKVIGKKDLYIEFASGLRLFDSSEYDAVVLNKNNYYMISIYFNYEGRKITQLKKATEESIVKSMLKTIKVLSEGEAEILEKEYAPVDVTAISLVEKTVKIQNNTKLVESKSSDVYNIDEKMENASADIKRRLDRFFEKLDSAYPDKVVKSLHKDHKKWGETLTKLYRELGYESGNALLEAYGYTVAVSDNKGGRITAMSSEKVIEEFKSRYADGPVYSSIKELFDANPDLAPYQSTLKNKAIHLFGMTLASYLVSIGILKEKEIKEKTVLPTIKERFDELIIQLQEKYKDCDNLPASVKELKSQCTDLDASHIESWALKSYGITAEEYLTKIGIIVKAKTSEEKLASVTKTLKERYSSGDKKAYSIATLIEENPDLPISTIGTWSRKFFGQNASEYLIEQGILSENEWIVSQRLENERRKEAEERLAAEEKALEVRIQAELSTTSSTINCDLPIYYVDEIDVCGDEANDWEYKDTYWGREGQLIIDDYVGDKKHIIVPAFINGRRVMGFGPACFQNCKAEIIEIPGTIKEVNGTNGYINEFIKCVIVGEGVQTIGESFLSAAPNLTEVKVSKSVKQLEQDFYMNIPFYGTPWFKNQEYVIIGDVLAGAKSDGAIMNIPSGVRRVCSKMAIEMPNLRKIIIPDTVIELCSEAFSYGAAMVQEVVIPKSLTKIGANAFGRSQWIEQQKGSSIIINNVLYKCEATAADLIIPDGVISIAGKVFKDNLFIKTVSFPETIKEIGEQAFSGCKNLTTINIPAGVECLGKACFFNCKNLSKVNLPDTLVEIGRSAFNSCLALTEITIGENVEVIGEKAFLNCRMLKSVNLGNKVKRILSEAFNGCNSLSSIILPDTIEEIGGEAFRNCASLEKIVIPNSINKISYWLFGGCKKLKDVKLPHSILEIGNFAFCGCAELEEVTIPKKVGQEAFRGCTKLKKSIFTDGIKVIAKNCFYGCSVLEEVIIPDSVELIEEGAFGECVSLSKVLLPEKLEKVGKSAFSGCIALEKIILPKSIDTIEDGAFKDCASLLEVEVPDSIQNFGLDVFTNTPYMKKEYGDFMIVNGVLSKYLGRDKDVIVPDGVITIEENSFAEAYHVESITMPDSVKFIGNKIMGTIFSWDDNPKPQLKKLVIGNNVSSIGAGAFENCDKLSDITFGTSLKIIGDSAFSGCTKLENIDLSNTAVIEVKQNAFSGCNKVKSIMFSNCIENIGREAFSGVYIRELILPQTIKSIERSSFCGVSKLYVYDTIDPNAVEAKDWKYDRWNGTVNSALSCVMLSVPSGYSECQGNTGWSSYHITVLSAETNAIRYRIFCDDEEKDNYRAMMFSAWGKNASFNFEDYDEYFMKTRNPIGRAEMAFCRIQYPEGLSGKHRSNYEAFLERCMFIERSARRIAEMIAKEDDVDRLKLLNQYHTIDSHNIDWIREELSSIDAKKCLAFLKEQFSR